jgi:hypothetical protein
MDVFNLTMTEKTCSCGKSSGKYIDNLNAEIKGNCKGIGFANNKFKIAYHLQKIEDDAQSCCDGVEFTAFFIPESAKSIRRV